MIAVTFSLVVAPGDGPKLESADPTIFPLLVEPAVLERYVVLD